MDLDREESLPKMAMYDTAFNILLIFLMLLALKMTTPVFVKESQDKKVQAEAKNQGAINIEGEYAITTTWDDQADDDVDTYVLDPSGSLVFYQRREDGLMHLDHDDVGKERDLTRDAKGNNVQIYKNEEDVIIRGIVAGEYVVNVHMFDKQEKEPRLVKVRLTSLKDGGAIIIEQQVTLTSEGDERTAFRFSLNTAGVVTDINQLQKKLTTVIPRQAASDEEMMDMQRRFGHEH